MWGGVKGQPHPLLWTRTLKAMLIALVHQFRGSTYYSLRSVHTLVDPELALLDFSVRGTISPLPGQYSYNLNIVQGELAPLGENFHWQLWGHSRRLNVVSIGLLLLWSHLQYSLSPSPAITSQCRISRYGVDKEMGKTYILADWHTGICHRSSKLPRRSAQLLYGAYAIRDGFRRS